MTDPITALTVLLLPPTVLLLVVIMARFGPEAGDAARPMADSEHLLQLKRLGALVSGLPKIPDHCAPSKPRVVPGKVHQDPLPSGLDHLLNLRRKRDDGVGPYAFRKISTALPRSSSAIQSHRG